MTLNDLNLFILEDIVGDLFPMTHVCAECIAA